MTTDRPGVAAAAADVALGASGLAGSAACDDEAVHGAHSGPSGDPRPCSECREPTAGFIEPDAWRTVPLCWRCYHAHEVAAVGGVMPPAPLRAPGAIEPFRAEVRPVPMAPPPPLALRRAVRWSDVIGVIRARGNLTVEEIADALSVRTQIVRAHLSGIVAQGYVVRRGGGYEISAYRRRRGYPKEATS